MGGLKTRELEKSGLENVGPNRRGGKGGTEKRGNIMCIVVVVLLYGLVSTRLQHSKNIHSCVA